MEHNTPSFQKTSGDARKRRIIMQQTKKKKSKTQSTSSPLSDITSLTVNENSNTLSPKVRNDTQNIEVSPTMSLPVSRTPPCPNLVRKPNAQNIQNSTSLNKKIRLQTLNTESAKSQLSHMTSSNVNNNITRNIDQSQSSCYNFKFHPAINNFTRNVPSVNLLDKFPETTKPTPKPYASPAIASNMAPKIINTPQFGSSMNKSQTSYRHAKQPMQSQHQSHTQTNFTNSFRYLPGLNLMEKFAQTTTTATNVSAIPELTTKQPSKTNHNPHLIPTTYTPQLAQTNGKEPMISQNHPSTKSAILKTAKFATKPYASPAIASNMMQNTLNTPQILATINTSQPSNRHAKKPKQSQHQSHTIPLSNNSIRYIPGLNLMDKFLKTTTTAPNVSAIPELTTNQPTPIIHHNLYLHHILHNLHKGIGNNQCFPKTILLQILIYVANNLCKIGKPNLPHMLMILIICTNLQPLHLHTLNLIPDIILYRLMLTIMLRGTQLCRIQLLIMQLLTPPHPTQIQMQLIHQTLIVIVKTICQMKMKHISKVYITQYLKIILDFQCAIF